ncbi:hypothetical protein CPB85DRAFT_1434090 [Mucidula mucida]|nr:hypothetical protein CPB85DRAFT_1434090 [Mucidula mucida]
MLFTSESLPYKPHPTVKYTVKSTTEVKPRNSALRYPSPEPDVKLVDPPPIPSELSHCGLVMYGYRIDEQQCQALGFLDLDDAADKIGAGIDKLRISEFAKAADIPEDHNLEYFTLHFAALVPPSAQ